jgi:hypothetical protein
MNTTRPSSYAELYRRLASVFTQECDCVDLEAAAGTALELRSFDFASRHCDVHSATLGDPGDRDIPQNRWFRYSVVAPKAVAGPQSGRFDRATILCHGLNEKSWNKYVPWAVRLAEHTGRPVILFPIAFHMNRAPAAWADPRKMMPSLRARRCEIPGLTAASVANVALSTRVGSAPQRFLTSGLQSFYDSLDVVREIASGRHPLFAQGTGVDFFAYSIGALLVEVLLMRNPEELFTDSRAFLFCGGAVMDRTMPVSRAIMDDAALGSLQRYFARIAGETPSQLPRDLGLSLAQVRDVDALLAMLFTDTRRSSREARLREIADRVAVAAMARDDVFPPDGLRESWRAADGSPLLGVDVFDPAYDYRHEQPFPARSARPDRVDAFFEGLFAGASRFLEAQPRVSRLAV